MKHSNEYIILKIAMSNNQRGLEKKIKVDAEYFGSLWQILSYKTKISSLCTLGLCGKK